MSSGEKSTLGCLALVFAPVLLIIGVIVFGMISSGLGGGSSAAPNRFEAIQYCEDRVREQLRAPSTAEFRSSATDTNPFRVTGTVDAQNAFGATVRNDFQCTVNITGDSFTVQIDRLG